MKGSRPHILVSTGVETRGEEFGDMSSSLSETYQHALLSAGAVPLGMPASASRDVIRACVQRCDGVLLTGGEDVAPELYSHGLPPYLRTKVRVTEDGGKRDLRECLLVDEVFLQKKPLLAICRGHQVLNVALGGTLIADIASQVPGAINHRRLDKRNEVVHEVRLTAGSLLSKIVGDPTLGVNSTHHQAVARVAAPLKVTALSADGIIEGLELKKPGVYGLPFLLSLQFHPERLVTQMREHSRIFLAFVRAAARGGNKHYEGQSPYC